MNNWNGKEWEGAKLGRMLADPAARKRAIEQLVAYVERGRFAGISIDFENIAVEGTAQLSALCGRTLCRAEPKRPLGVGERAGERPGL